MPGVWAIDFAKENPQAFVIGTDLSAIQPRFAAPPNCTFIQDDAEDEWVFAQAFDYVHLSMMITCFDDHKRVMRNIFENLKPGGWVEYQDTTFDIGNANGNTGPVQLWASMIVEAGLHLGKSILNFELLDYRSECWIFLWPSSFSIM